MRYAANHGGLRVMLTLLVVASVCVRPLQDMLPGFSGDVFNSGARGLAWLTSSVGVGAMLGAVYIASRGALSGLTTLAMIGCFGTATAALGFVATQNLWVAVFFGAMLGFSINVMSTSIQALMQLATDDRMRGRVMALYLLLFRGFPALGALALGFLANVIGLRLSFALAAGLCLVFLVLMLPRRKAVAAMMESAAEALKARREQELAGEIPLVFEHARLLPARDVIGPQLADVEVAHLVLVDLHHFVFGERHGRLARLKHLHQRARVLVEMHGVHEQRGHGFGHQRQPVGAHENRLVRARDRAPAQRPAPSA